MKLFPLPSLIKEKEVSKVSILHFHNNYASISRLFSRQPLPQRRTSDTFLSQGCDAIYVKILKYMKQEQREDDDFIMKSAFYYSLNVSQACEINVAFLKLFLLAHCFGIISGKALAIGMA